MSEAATNQGSTSRREREREREGEETANNKIIDKDTKQTQTASQII